MKKLFNSQTVLYLIPFIIAALITILVFIGYLTDPYFPGPGITTNDLIDFILYITILLELMACAINFIWGVIAWIVFSMKKKNSYKARKRIIVAIIGACLLIIAFLLINRFLRSSGNSTENIPNQTHIINID